MDATNLEKYTNYLVYDLGLKKSTVKSKRCCLALLYKIQGSEILEISNYNDIHELIVKTAQAGSKHPWGRNNTYKCFTYMKDYYWWAFFRAQIIKHNPMSDGFKYRKAPQKEPVVIRKELWQKLWASPFMSVRDIAIMIMFEATGVRKSELTSLNVGDVDFRSGARGCHVKHGKMDKFRWIPIPKRYAMYLRIYVSFLKEQGIAGPEMPLFPTEKGTRISGNRVHRMIRERGQEIGVHAYPHAKRHGYVTQLVEDGTPIAVAQQLAGHANINQTASYTHLSSRFLRDEVDKVG